MGDERRSTYDVQPTSCLSQSVKGNFWLWWIHFLRKSCKGKGTRVLIETDVPESIIGIGSDLVTESSQTLRVIPCNKKVNVLKQHKGQQNALEDPEGNDHQKGEEKTDKNVLPG
jgi:hypothetical protein